MAPLDSKARSMYCHKFTDVNYIIQFAVSTLLNSYFVRTPTLEACTKSNRELRRRYYTHDDEVFNQNFVGTATAAFIMKAVHEATSSLFCIHSGTTACPYCSLTVEAPSFTLTPKIQVMEGFMWSSAFSWS